MGETAFKKGKKTVIPRGKSFFYHLFQKGGFTLGKKKIKWAKGGCVFHITKTVTRKKNN